RSEARLELNEPPAQSQPRRVPSRVRRLGAKQPSLDEVPRRRRLGSLGEIKDECGLLRGEADHALAGSDEAACRIELDPPESVRSRPTCTSLDEASCKVGVDVRHRYVAFDEVGARAQLVSVANRGRVDLRRGENDHWQPRMVSANPGQEVEAR